MKKFSLVLLLLIAAGLLVAQTTGQFVYKTSSFSGGLNLATDSINISPSEGVAMKNFMMDKFGALHKRYGIHNWNDTLIAASQIRDAHYIESLNKTKRMFFSAGNYVYEESTWTDLNNVWSGTEIDYTIGSIDTSIGKYVYGNDSTRFIMAVAPNDRLVLGATTYTIDSILADTCIHVTTTVSGTKSGDYRILKYINGDVQLKSWSGNLYVMDSKGFPFVYNGISPVLLGVVDTGTVTNIVPGPSSPDSVESQYSDDGIFIIRGSNRVVANSKDPPAMDSIVVGDIFTLEFNMFSLDWNSYEWSSEITDTEPQYIDLLGSVPSTWRTFNGTYQLFNMAVDSILIPSGVFIDARWYITRYNRIIRYGDVTSFFDSSKFWTPNEYQGFYVVNGKNARQRSFIRLNTERMISSDSTKGTASFSAGDKYYLCWQLPSMIYDKIADRFGNPLHRNADSSQVDKTFLNSVTFHRNRAYYTGLSVASFNIDNLGGNSIVAGDTILSDRVYVSGIGRPSYIRPDFNFDLSGAGMSQSIYAVNKGITSFELQNDIYIVTQNSIYRISGEPAMDITSLSNACISKELGTNQSRGIIVTQDNIVYIMNHRGLWLFDGNSVNKIWATDANSISKSSYAVGPLTEKYRKCNMVAGQFGDNIFFSYPESSATIVMHYPTRAFTFWDVGMTFINSQSTSIDSGYFLFSSYGDSGYVHRYPAFNSVFFDRFVPAETTGIGFEYRSGWFNPFIGREIVAEQIGLQVTKGNEPIDVTIYYDIAGYDSLWTATLATAAAKRVWRKTIAAKVQGDYLAFSIKTGASMAYPESTGDFTLSEVYMICHEGSTPID